MDGDWHKMVIPQTFDLGVTCRSFPALAARIRTLQSAEANSATPPLHIERLVQAYTILSYPQVEDKAKATVHVVQHILERMRRLASAYYEWQTFEPAAYFDLTNAQCALLLNIEERVSTVLFTFTVEPLLPSFRNTADYFRHSFFPGYQQRHSSAEMAEDFFSVVQPAFVERWLRLQRLLVQVRSQLAVDINFLAMNAAEEERWRYREAWNGAVSPGLDARLTPPLRMIPSLTLSHEFPLPAYRQPGRKRRLWMNRERRRVFGRRGYR